MVAKRIPLQLAAVGLFVALGLPSTSLAEVVVYEGTSFPEEEGWQPNPFCEPDRWLDSGWFFQHVNSCEGSPPPGGQQESFTRSLEEFVGEQEFFLEWRMHTDGDGTEITGVAPASLVAGGSFGVSYHFTIARDQVRFIQDNFLPIIWVDLDPKFPHTYRVELHGDDTFAWYVDEEEVHVGVPEGSFPLIGSVLQWRAKSWFLESTSQWDYVRYGTIAAEGSGDFDSDGELDGDDLYFFQECFLGPGGSWAGCAWADMDSDGDTDCKDWALFVEAWSTPETAPCSLTCGDCNRADFNGDGVVDPFDLAMLLASWGACADCEACPPDLTGDCTVGPTDLAMLLGSWG